MQACDTSNPTLSFCGQVTAQPCLDCLSFHRLALRASLFFLFNQHPPNVHDSKLQQHQWHHSTRWPHPPHARDEARCLCSDTSACSHMRVAACNALASSQSLSLCTQRQTDRQTETSPNTQPLWGNPACNSTSRCQLQPHCGCTLRLPVVSCNAPSQPRQAGAGTCTHVSQEQAHRRCSGPRPQLRTRVAGQVSAVHACTRHPCTSTRPQLVVGPVAAGPANVT